MELWKQRAVALGILALVWVTSKKDRSTVVGIIVVYILIMVLA